MRNPNHPTNALLAENDAAEAIGQAKALPAWLHAHLRGRYPQLMR